MQKISREQVAEQLVRAAEMLMVAEGDEAVEEEVDDPQFTQKVAALRTALSHVRNKKRMKLSRFGITDPIRPAMATVEDLVDVLLKVAQG